MLRAVAIVFVCLFVCFLHREVFFWLSYLDLELYNMQNFTF